MHEAYKRAMSGAFHGSWLQSTWALSRVIINPHIPRLVIPLRDLLMFTVECALLYRTSAWNILWLKLCPDIPPGSADLLLGQF